MPDRASTPAAPEKPEKKPRAPRKKAAPAQPASSVIQQFEATLKFPIDVFQREAMEALEAGRSVLVSAPTGSGKTLVAEFAVFLARHLGRRCIFTTPLKALSNQKYRDLRHEMGDEVGLVTGDVVINPQAPVLIMTTEILRNMLQVDPAQVDDVSHVVLDEAHYIGADGRGTVWEETIVFLGKNTRIVALSATIPNADELATWVSEVHQPMDVVTHLERPVPLEPWVYTKKLEPLFDGKRRVRIKNFGKDSKDDWIDTPKSSMVVKALTEKQMTPAIFFVFSRMGCEREAIEVIRSAGDLTTKAEKKAIQAAVDAAIAQTPGMLASNATKGWLERLPAGVAPHHAGLLPPLKLLIEELFQKNLLKVVFATETLAAGINMPARTVVVPSLSKRTDEGHRLLTVSEFAQMTGRAGRRGMDTVGYGVVLNSHQHDIRQVTALFEGSPEPLRSRFTLNYNMVINLTHNYPEAQARRIVEQCFSQFQSNATIVDLIRLRDQARTRLEAIEERFREFPEDYLAPGQLQRFEAAKKARLDAQNLVKDMEKNLRGHSEKEAERALLAAPYNSFVVVKRAAAPAPELALLLDKYRSKKGVQFGALFANGNVMRLGAQDLVLATGAAVRGVPGDLRHMAEPMSYLQTKRIKMPPGIWDGWLEAAGIDPVAVLPETREPAKLQAARKAWAAAEKAWAEASTVSGKRLDLTRKAEKEADRLRKDVQGYENQVKAIQSRFWNQFMGLRTVLERADYLRGRELLPRGVALAHLRTQNELVAAETLASGVLEDLTPVELAAAVSVMIAEPPRGRMAWRPMKPSPRVVDLTYEMADHVASPLARIEDAVARQFKELEPSPIMVATEYCGMVQHWAAGFQWSHITEWTGIDEGQLVRHIRHVIDMLNQIKDVPGLRPAFLDKVQEAILTIDRDIVREVF